MRECRAVQGASGQCRTSRSSRNIRTVQVPSQTLVRKHFAPVPSQTLRAIGAHSRDH
jgi:hypothetical protein